MKKLKVFTAHVQPNGQWVQPESCASDFILINENIDYEKSITDVDIVISDHSLDANYLHKFIEVSNPKLCLLHSGNHYYENGCWRHDFHNKKISSTYPDIKFLVLEHNVNSNLLIKDNYVEIYYDFLFNYYRKFMTGTCPSPTIFNKGPAAELSSWVKAEDSDLTNTKREKIFLSLNKLYPDQGRTIYRRKIFEFLYEKINLGFLSGPGRLECEGVVENLIGWNKKNLHIPTEYLGKNGTFTNDMWRWFSPAHSYYYNNSYISIYGETIEHGSVVAPTEKTFIPLWKGHLILPFSSNNFISALKKLGFKMPEQIDYSYDTIVDNNLRWESYLKELNRLLNLSQAEWQKIYEDTIDLRLYNRDIFYSKEDYAIKPILEKFFN